MTVKNKVRLPGRDASFHRLPKDAKRKFLQEQQGREAYESTWYLRRRRQNIISAVVSSVVFMVLCPVMADINLGFIVLMGFAGAAVGYLLSAKEPNLLLSAVFFGGTAIGITILAFYIGWVGLLTFYVFFMWAIYAGVGAGLGYWIENRE